MARVCLIGVLREVAQNDDDLVLDVERGVAVVAEALRLRDDEAVAGEDHRTGHLGIVREGERLDLAAPRSPGRRPRRGVTDSARAAVAAAGRELEWHEHVAAAGQRPGAEARQLRRDVIGREPLARGPGLAPFERDRRQASRRARASSTRLRFARTPTLQRAARQSGGNSIRHGKFLNLESPCTGSDSDIVTGVSTRLARHRGLTPIRGGAAFRAARAAWWFHSARKICPSRPPPRLDWSRRAAARRARAPAGRRSRRSR